MTKHIRAETRRAGSETVQPRLLALYDDMAEFQDQCSFLCDAFASITAQNEVIGQETIRGVSIYSEWIKEQVGQLKAELRLCYEEVDIFAGASATSVNGSIETK